MNRSPQVFSSGHSKENKNPMVSPVSESGPTVSSSFILRANTLSASATGPSKSAGAMDLFEFLRSAELEHYFTSFHEQLRVRTVAQLKYVQDSDLQQMGLTAPEQRRLWKFFERRYPQTTAGKLRKRLSRSTSGRAPNGHSHSMDDGLSSNLVNGHGKREALHHSGDLLLDEEDYSTGPFIHRHHHLILPEHLELGTQLGEGEFGKVHQGVWHSESGPIQVAIKVLSTTLLDTGQMTDFLQEVAVMHSISHANIVRLYGVVMERVSVQMVTELAPLRSLLECLREETLRSSLTILQLHSFSLQIAQGMSYLERKRLIHRDLAARNILVFSKDKVKISDFGMSKALQLGKEYYQTNINVNMKLPMAWCAPESINYLRFTSASDVWAYGVVLWEMFSYGFQPWAGLTGDQILDQIDEPVCARLSKPELCPTQHHELMLRCWEHEARKRCTFEQIVGQLPRMSPERYRLIQDVTESGLNCKRVGESGSRATHVENNGTPLFSKGDVLIILDKGELWKAYHVASNRVTLLPSTYLAPVLAVGTMDPLTASTLSEASTTNGSGVAAVGGIYQYITGRLKRNKRHSDTSSTTGSINSRGITRDMISLPQNDFRHVMHVGSDGNTFGDVGFLKNVAHDTTDKNIASPAITVRSECDRESMFGDGVSLNSGVSGFHSTAIGGGSGGSSVGFKNSSNRPLDGVSSPSDTLTSVSDLDPSGQASVISSALNSSSSTSHKLSLPQQNHTSHEEGRKSLKDKLAPLLSPSNGLNHSTRSKPTSTGLAKMPSRLIASKVNGDPSDSGSDCSEAYECIEVSANMAAAGSPWQSPTNHSKHTKHSYSNNGPSPPSLPPARPQSSAISQISSNLESHSWEDTKCVDEKTSQGESLLGGSLFDDILKCLDNIGTLSSSEDAQTPQDASSTSVTITPSNADYTSKPRKFATESLPSPVSKEEPSVTKSINASFETRSTPESLSAQAAPKKQFEKKLMSESVSSSGKTQAPSSGRLERKGLFSSFKPGNHESNGTSNSTALYSKPFKNGLGLPFTSKKTKSHSVPHETVPVTSTAVNIISGPVLISTTNTHCNTTRSSSDFENGLSTVSSSHISGSASRSSSASNTLSSGTGAANGLASINNALSGGCGAMRALQRNKDGVFLASTNNTGACGSGTLQRRRISQLNSSNGGGGTSLTLDSTLNRTRQPSLPLTTQVARSITEVVASSHPTSGATLNRRLSLVPPEEQDNESTNSLQSSPSKTSRRLQSVSYSPQRRSQTLSTTSQLSSSSNKSIYKEDDLVKPASILADDFWGDGFSKWMGSSLVTKPLDSSAPKANSKTAMSLIERCETRRPPAFGVGELDDDDDEVCAL